MAIKDIQARLDEKVKAHAERDFKKAIQQAEQLLEPFFKPVESQTFSSPAELVKLQGAFNTGSRIGKYGSVYLCRDMSVPECYIQKKRSEASKEFIEKVESLQEQIDELYDIKAER